MAKKIFKYIILTIVSILILLLTTIFILRPIYRKTFRYDHKINSQCTYSYYDEISVEAVKKNKDITDVNEKKELFKLINELKFIAPVRATEDVYLETIQINKSEYIFTPTWRSASFDGATSDFNDSTGELIEVILGDENLVYYYRITDKEWLNRFAKLLSMWNNLE